MAQNVGTLVSAAIRPNDTLDLIATAYASEIMGGLHKVDNTTDRDNIIFERREWGMLCYVKDLDKTYQLRYNYSSSSIMNNLNWVEFNGSGGGGGTEWIDSVIEVRYSQPGTPTNGDRYLIGLQPGDTITGANWGTYSSGYVGQWNSTTNKWDLTTPTDGMSVRVDNEDNSIYRYEGIFPTGVWGKEKTGQVRDVNFSTIDGFSYSATTLPVFDAYNKDMVFLAKFTTQNLGNTVSIDINSLGYKQIKKPTPSGVTLLNPFDIQPDIVYSLVYDGTYFQLNRPFVNEDLFNVKYYIEPNDYIVVPPYYQYWVYSDLTIDGYLVNYGQVIVANGGLNINSGTFANYGQLSFVNFNAGLTTSFNDTVTIQFTQSNTIYGLSVSAIVKDSSLTASKLSTGLNGGATAGYLLSVDTNGDFSWVSPNSTLDLTYNDKNFLMSQNSVGNGFFTGLTITDTPDSYVMVFINGVETDLGYGSTNSSSCYFSSDGGTTAKSFGNIVAGDGLYWNTSLAGFALTTDLPDRISLNYLI